MRAFLSLIAVLCLATSVHAAAVFGPAGAFATAFAASGACPDVVIVDGYRALYIEYDITAGAGTIEIEQLLPDGTNFTSVSGSSKTADALVKIEDPGGKYRCNQTGAGGTWTIRFYAVGRK